MSHHAAHLIQTFLPRSRCWALARGEALPEQSAGAYLFADISGFTPLTEALRSRLGPRQGAEALTTVINRVFEALIGQVHAYGGEVMGFAGDAMSVCFDAAGSEPGATAGRALRCATAMQAEMGQFAALSTPDGQTLALSMKVGLAYGPARRLLVGRPELGQFDLLVGESLTRMAAAEHHAEQGEIIGAPEYPALVGAAASWGAAREGFLPLLAYAAPEVERPPETTAPATALPDLALETLRPYFPPELFASLAAAPEGYLAELRPVVSAFVRFEGLDYVNDPAVGEKLNAYVGLAQRLAAQYQGNLIRLDYGDKGSVLHAVFGAPVAYEGDEAHAVGWALDLQAEARQLLFITAQMIGMARGQVYAGALGASTRRGYTLMGDEVNASARLMQACQPWQTLVSQPVLQAAQKQYLFHQFPGFQVKGKYEPVPVGMPVAPLPTMPPLPAAPLVGREAELALLDQCLTALTQGTGQTLRIVGGAGVGKSRLTAELVQRAMQRGVRTLTGSGQSVGQGTPYLAWRELIRNLFGLQAAWPALQQVMQIQNMLQWINPEWAPRVPLLGDLLGLEIPDTPLTAGLAAELRQQSLFALLGDLLGRMAMQQPLLILIEDCHWLDAASAALFEALALSLAGARVLLAATYRPPLDPRQPVLPGLEQLAHGQRIDLSELTPEATRQLVTTRLGGELPEALMGLILERAQGNPFFVEELAETIRETSRLKMENGHWVLESTESSPQLPATVQKVVLARVDRLAEPERLTLKVSSVVGRQFPVELVAGVHPAQPEPGALKSQLGDLEQREFIQPEQLAPEAIDRFKHNITQEVAYETLLYAQRRDLHRAAAAWIEANYAEALSAYYGALVYHYQRAEERGRERHYARLAGLQAVGQYANAEALVYLSRALELTPEDDLAGRFELLAARERIYTWLAQRDAQRADLAAMVELAVALEAASGATTYRYQVALRQGYLAEVTADFPAALASVQQALDLAANPLEEGQAWVAKGRVLALQGQHEAARQATQTALAAAQALGAQPAAQALLANCQMDLGELARRQGDWQTAAAHYLQALESFQAQDNRHDSPNCLLNLGLVATGQGQHAAARDYFEQARGLVRQIGDRRGESLLLVNLGLGAYYEGDLSAADAYYTQALALCRAIGNRTIEALTLGNLGWDALVLGDYAAGRAYGEQSLALARQLGDKYNEAASLSNLGLLLHQMNEQTAALEHSQQALALAQAAGYRALCAEAQTHAGHSLAALGRGAEAAQAYQAAEALYRQVEQPDRACEALAGQARLHLAQGALAQALALVEQILPSLGPSLVDNAEEGLRVYLTCCQVLQAAGDPRAQAVLASAQGLLQERAARLSNEAQRRAYLENVPFNREIWPGG
jgi:class 3 adenylate cyclase/tetratricopeptide (TPR) repeat protein